jgi:hypothetical protein
MRAPLHRWLILWSFFSTALPATVAAADHAAKTDNAAIERFHERERATISSHYLSLQREAAIYEQYHEPAAGKKKNNADSKHLPPGLQKKAAQGRLPPGWQKKLKIGAILPPDVLAVADPLPPRLIAQLPAGPAGTITVHVDGHIIRVLEASRTIVDFFALQR